MSSDIFKKKSPPPEWVKGSVDERTNIKQIWIIKI